MNTMTLSDVEAHDTLPADKSVCRGCNFKSSLSGCIEARRKGIETFGGDCITRQVIYIKAAPQPVKE